LSSQYCSAPVFSSQRKSRLKKRLTSRSGVGVEGKGRATMRLSTIWIAVSIVLSINGHPASAIVPIALWVLHRRFEKNVLDREE
jgi:hypothetical protein